MTDWQPIFAPMEQTLAHLLGQTVVPAPEEIATEPALSGAVPLLDEVLAPVSRALSQAEEHARAADMHLEDAHQALTGLRDAILFTFCDNLENPR